MAAVDEHPLRMSLLEKGGADLLARDVRSKRKHCGAAPIGVVQPLDQVRVTRSTTAGAHREATAELRLGRRRERAGLLVADVDPLDPGTPADRVDERVEAVAGDSVDAPDACLAEHLEQLVGKRAPGYPPSLGHRSCIMHEKADQSGFWTHVTHRRIDHVLCSIRADPTRVGDGSEPAESPQRIGRRDRRQALRIAVVGRGNVGGGLANLWERAGHEVVRHGRDGGDVSDREAVLLAVPGGAIAEVLARLAGLEGKTVIDATNLLDARPPAGFASNAEYVKSKTGGATAKSFNINFASLYERLGDARVAPCNLWSGDEEAREIVERLTATPAMSRCGSEVSRRRPRRRGWSISCSRSGRRGSVSSPTGWPRSSDFEAAGGETDGLHHVSAVTADIHAIWGSAAACWAPGLSGQGVNADDPGMRHIVSATRRGVTSN